MSDPRAQLGKLAFLSVLAGGAALPSAAEGPWTLTGRIDAGVSATENPNLRRVAPGVETDSFLSLGLDFGYETPTSRFVLSLDSDIEGFGASGGTDDLGTDPPRASLSYRLQGPDSLFSVTTFLRTADLANAFYLDIDGDDIRDLIDSSIGEVETSRTNLAYSWGIDAPFGVDLRATRSEQDYTDTVDPSLLDTTTVSGQATARFRLSPVATLRTFAARTDRVEGDIINAQTDDMGVGLFYEIGPALRFNGQIASSSYVEDLLGNVTSEGDIVSLDLSLSRDLPNGLVTLSGRRSFNQGVAETIVRADRSMELPGAELSFGAGLSYADDGKSGVVASLTYYREFPIGALSAAAERSIARDLGEADETITAVDLAYARELTPVVSMGLNANYVNSRVDGRASVDNLALGLNFTTELTEDWAWTLEYAAQFRTDSNNDLRSTNRIAASIGRSFSIRP